MDREGDNDSGSSKTKAITKHETYRKQHAGAYTLQMKTRHAGVSEQTGN